MGFSRMELWKSYNRCNWFHAWFVSRTSIAYSSLIRSLRAFSGLRAPCHRRWSAWEEHFSVLKHEGVFTHARSPRPHLPPPRSSRPAVDDLILPSRLQPCMLHSLLRLSIRSYLLEPVSQSLLRSRGACRTPSPLRTESLVAPAARDPDTS